MYIDSVKLIPNLFSKHFENQLDSNTLCPERNCMVQNGTQPQGQLQHPKTRLRNSNLFENLDFQFLYCLHKGPAFQVILFYFKHRKSCFHFGKYKYFVNKREDINFTLGCFSEHSE